MCICVIYNALPFCVVCLHILLFVAKLPRISVVIYAGCLHLLSPAPLNQLYLSSQLSGMTMPFMTKLVGSSLTLLDL